MIPCSKPSISGLERALVDAALRSGDVCLGRAVGDFEWLWAGMNERAYGVSCSSGTTALFLALRALGIGPGDEVIVPEYTMVSTAWAVTYCGATPIFVDCKDDLTMDVSQIVITPRTKAIMPTAIYGRPCGDVSHFGLPVVEDLAEGHGIKPRGTIACYSFYGNKIITTGEGGMCLTDDPNLAAEMRDLSNVCMNKERTMLHARLGYNFRMSNIQAAIGFGQAQRLDELLDARKKVEAWYDRYLPECFKMPPREVVWMYDINVPHQEKMKRHLRECGIESRYGFKPMSMQPTYDRPFQHLNAYYWSRRVLYLPTYPELTEEEVKTVASAVSDLVQVPAW